jgi:hypothetical protein
MADVCVLGPLKSFLQEALVRDLDPGRHQAAMTSCSIFSIRVRHAATSYDVEDASRWWTRAQERIVRLGSIAIPGQSLTQNALYDCEHVVFNPWNCLPEHRPRQRQPDAARRQSCLAAGTAETEHGGS